MHKEKNLRDQVIPPLLLKHEVQMRRPPTMAPELLQQLADGAVVGNGVADGLDALEPEDALFVAKHDAALAGPLILAALVLHVVVAAAVRLPDVDLDVADGLAVDVFHGADAKQGYALRV